MTESLKSFIERNIDLIENKKLNFIYDSAYVDYMEGKLKPLDISTLTDILSELFDDEPIFDTDIRRVPPFYRLATDNLRHLEIPEGIEYIGESAFRNCKKLQSLNLPKTLSEIDDDAFKGCDELHSIFYNGSIADWGRIKLGMQSFGSSEWIHKDKTVYCNDGEVIV